MTGCCSSRTVVVVRFPKSTLYPRNGAPVARRSLIIIITFDVPKRVHTHTHTHAIEWCTRVIVVDLECNNAHRRRTKVIVFFEWMRVYARSRN